ncbi:MAG: hypothetical protein IIW39_04855 [Clostridia bacterium]|nr:hypothetical protein [Clostridia bacterium]
MKKCLLTCLLALSVLISGCADSGNTSDKLISELNGAIGSVNSEDRASGEYLIEITVSGVTLYYASGDIAFDRKADVAHNEFTSSYMGNSVVSQNYYSNGKLVSVEGTNSNVLDRTSEQIMGKFPYAKLLELPDEVSDVTEKSSSVGRTVELTRQDTAKIFETVVGDGIYSLATVIKKPQTDKTQFGDTKCTYTVKDGRAVGCRYEFTVKLFDTPAYVPGYSVPESEYTLELSVVAKVNYDCFGNDVKLYEYSQSEES